MSVYNIRYIKLHRHGEREGRTCNGNLGQEPSRIQGSSQWLGNQNNKALQKAEIFLASGHP